MSGWTQEYSVDDPNKHKGEAQDAESSALNMFRQMDLKGRANTIDDITIKAIHQNTIS